MTAQIAEQAQGPERALNSTGRYAGDAVRGLVLDSHAILGEGAVVFVRGELDIATADHLHHYVRRIVRRPSPVVVIDLAGTTFCDANGLRSLVKIGNDADLVGCRVVLANLNPLMTKILRLGALDQRFATVSTLGIPHSAETRVPATRAL